MRRCAECAVDIEGKWDLCPLCHGPVTGDPTPSPLPTVPLRFSRRRVYRVLFLISAVVILGSFLAQLLFAPQAAAFGAVRSVWMGAASMWLLVMLAIRKRRNIAKDTVYLVVAVGLTCVYWDYLTGWHAWSLTWAVPLVSAFSIVALLITVRAMSIDVGEYIVYTTLTVVLGLVPVVFLVFGWVSTSLPSILCIALSAGVLVLLQLTRGRDMRHELAKRLHL